MSTTTLTSKGQITLTKAVRDRLALKKGDKFEVGVGRDGSLVLTREAGPSINSAFGALHGLAPRKSASISDMRAAVLARARLKRSRNQA